MSTPEYVTVDGVRAYDADDADGDRLDGLALAAYFGSVGPGDQAKASGYERWRAIREARESEFFKQQMAHKGKR
jgi:hypothetical protein